jgi:hypothetical protein
MNVTDIRDVMRGKAQPYLFPVLHAAPSPVYLQAALHEGVLVAELARALTDHGMTMSNIAGQGVVIHRIGQDPNRPVDRPPG